MKALIKLILGLAGLAVIVLLAVVITLATLDPNDYRDWIGKQVEERTGRTLVLGGDIGLTYYPWLGLEAHKVTLGNAAGFGDTPFFSADYLKLRIKLLPMFKDHYEVDTVSVHGAVINLARNKQGLSNWDDLVSHKKSEKAEAFPLAAVVLGGVDIQQAGFNWRDAGTGADYRISNMDIKTDALRYGEPLKLSLNMDLKVNKPAVNGRVSLTGTIAYDLDKQLYRIRPLDLVATLKSKNIPAGETRATLAAAIELNLDDDTAKIAGLKLYVLDTGVTGNLNASHIQSPAPAVQLSIKVNGSDLAQLFKVAEIEPLASQIARLSDRHFTLNTSLDADLQRGDIDVSKLALTMLGATVKGDIKARNVLSATPEYKGRLKAAGPDLPTLMQVIGQFQGGSKSALTAYGLKFAGMKRRAFRIDAGFDADLKSGDIDIPSLNIDTLGIKVSGNLKARDMHAAKGSVNGKLRISGKKMPQLLRAMDQQALAGVLQSMSFTAGISGNSGNLTLKPMALKARLITAQTGKKPVVVSLNADTKINLDKGTLRMAGLSLKGLGLNLRGHVKASKILQAPVFKGQLSIAPFNLRSLMTRLKQKLPPTADKKVFTKVGLDTHFAGSSSKLKIRQLALALDETKIKGNVSVVDFTRPAIKFGIDIDQINVDRYLPPPAGSKGRKALTPETAAGAAAQLPLKTLRALNVNGHLSIGKLTVSKAKLTNVKLSLQGKDGKITLNPATARLYRGTYSGKITLNAAGKLPKLTINSSLKDIHVAPLLRDVTGKAKLRGKGNFSAALFALGSNSAQLKQTLNGQMSFNFKNGAIKGFDLGKRLRQINQFRKGGDFKVTDREETDFSEITGNPVAKGGVIRMDDLQGKAPAFRFTGKGVLANLRKNRMNYLATVTVVATAQGQGGKGLIDLKGVALPVKIKGVLNDPQIKLDWGGVLGSLLTNKLTGGIKNILPIPVPGGKTPTATTATDKPPDPGKELLNKALDSIFH